MPQHDNFGKKWSKEETILAFDLYCRTPFGKIGKSNQMIIELASALNRTASSVALKMSNLAAYDPALRARSVVGMQHTSKLDAEVFEEYNQNLEELAEQARIIKKTLGIGKTDDLIESSGMSTSTSGDYREQLTKVRIGQYAFRAAILNAYNHRCCITGLAIPQLLIASHIKPWAISSEKTERTNPTNGLCLNSFHDKAFDQGFLTITKDYQIVISTQLSEAKMDDETRNWFMSYEGKMIALPDKFYPSRNFIEYHNDVIFRH